MTYRSFHTRMGLAAAALSFLCVLAATPPADAGQFNFKSQLRSSGISLKIVRLDRTDGFLFGVSFSGPNNAVVIAPGFAGRLLVQARGSEVVMQRDATGTMQVISADGDFAYTLCIIQAVVTFLSDMTLCESDPACVFTSIVELVTNIVYCGEASEPTV